MGIIKSKTKSPQTADNEIEGDEYNKYWQHDPISKLPCELILYIFRMLDSRSLHAAFLANPMWCGVIKGDQKLRRKLYQRIAKFIINIEAKSNRKKSTNKSFDMRIQIRQLLGKSYVDVNHITYIVNRGGYKDEKICVYLNDSFCFFVDDESFIPVPITPKIRAVCGIDSYRIIDAGPALGILPPEARPILPPSPPKFFYA